MAESLAFHHMMRYLGFQGGRLSFMLKGAIYFFAFSLLVFGCSPIITHQPSSPLSPLPPYEPPPFYEITVSVPPPIEEEVKPIEKQEMEPVIKEEEKVALKLVPIPAPLLLPDIAITNLSLNSKRRLIVSLSNIGDSSFPMEAGNLKIFIDGQLKGIYPLNSLSDQPLLPPKRDVTFTTPFTIIGRHEIQAHLKITPEMMDSKQENNQLKKILEGLPFRPDIVVSDLDLTEDLELSIVLSNTGEVDLRKGATFRFRIFVNDRKVSEFDHFISVPLRANLGNQYTILPPYRVGIGGFSKVKVSISPRSPSDDSSLENNVLERVFIIFPFKIGPQTKEEFSFSLSPPHSQGGGGAEKIKVEARWEGGGSPLMLSFSGTGQIKNFPAISGKGPLKAEFPTLNKESQKGSFWKILVHNLIEKKVEGHLIIQHP